jgi:hypothetical protein
MKVPQTHEGLGGARRCTVIAFVKGGMFFGVETAGYVNDLSQVGTALRDCNRIKAAPSV